MTQRIVRGMVLYAFGMSFLLGTACLPGCGGSDDGSKGAAAANAANPNATKAAEAEPSGLVGPKSKKAPVAPAP